MYFYSGSSVVFALAIPCSFHSFHGAGLVRTACCFCRPGSPTLLLACSQLCNLNLYSLLCRQPTSASSARCPSTSSPSMSRFCLNDVDIYIMVECLSVTKNQHFLLGVSCNHPGWFFMVLGRFLWFFMVLGQVL